MAAKRPARASGATGVLAGAGAVLLTVGVRPALLPVGLALAGLAAVGLGAAVARTGYRGTGGLVAAAGAVVVLGAVGVAASAGEVSVALALVPGLAGFAVLATAVLPVRGGGSRWLVKLGAGLVFVAVLAAALFHLAPLVRLLGGVVGAVLAWDAADNAIGIGQQLGRRAETVRIEAVHLAGTAAVGVAGVAAAVVVRGLSVGAVSLEAFVLLLAAVVLLTLSLHG